MIDSIVLDPTAQAENYNIDNFYNSIKYSNVKGAGYEKVNPGICDWFFAAGF